MLFGAFLKYFLKDRIREYREDILQSLAFAFIQHCLPQYYVPSKYSILLRLVKTSEEGCAKVERLQRFERWEERLEFLQRALVNMHKTRRIGAG
jgi:hypothetical protein